MKIAISILLVLLPILSRGLQYFFSKKNSMMDSFRKHWTCYYGDWIFVFINLFFVYSASFNSRFYLFLVISFLANLLIHSAWGNENKINKINWHLFHRWTGKLNQAGIVHLIFSTIESAIVASIFFFKPIVPFIFIELALFVIFGIFIIYGSKRIHWNIHGTKKANSKIEKMDWIVGWFLMTCILVKFLFLIG